jgi:tRNA(Ile)-lysidine synthase
VAKVTAAEQAALEAATPPITKSKISFVERFDFEKMKLPLIVRPPRPGDRFVPLGLSDEKKIGKFLTAQRIPHETRERVLLVEDREKIIWVWPIRISERAKVTPDTRQILRLQIMRSSEV